VLWTDCTFANLLDYYPTFSNLSARSIRDGHDAERRALSRCDLILFSSQWAADSAIHDYGIDPAKIRLAPFGSNMPGERSPDVIERLIAQRLATLGRKVSLVLIGVDWYRKGADIASDAVANLVARGISAELTVVGCSPPDGAMPPRVRFAGFIDKSKPQGFEELARLLEKSHFLILPSRADCSPVVFCEAASYGLPSLASRTGGIKSIITDGINGQTFPSTATPEAWADRIAAIVCEPEHYSALCRSSFQAYRERLNWATSGQVVKRLLEDLLQKSASKRPRG
jgi:glycosyltransferase involved in cell wall biosynthesis